MAGLHNILSLWERIEVRALRSIATQSLKGEERKLVRRPQSRKLTTAKRHKRTRCYITKIETILDSSVFYPPFDELRAGFGKEEQGTAVQNKLTLFISSPQIQDLGRAQASLAIEVDMSSCPKIFDLNVASARPRNPPSSRAAAVCPLCKGGGECCCATERGIYESA
jgi:hypothetical protein